MMAEQLRVSALDTVDESDDPLVATNTTRIIHLAVAHARSELGLLTYSAANVLVVSDTIRKFLRGHGLRPSHISMHFNTAVKVYFLRSTYDQELELMSNSRMYKKYLRTNRSA